MVTIKRHAIVLHPRAKLFKLVDQVEDYPDFLPWCGETKVLARTDEITRATILINYKGVKQSFTTENFKTYPEQMLIKLINGPFKKLEGRWQFLEIEENACRIELELHYEFSNLILDKLISPVFSMIANTFIDNFVAQANKDIDA
ncbi:type II toxin-antitoxin system RatA family toxin [Methylophilaceae bacterium]|jgi:ribosome-associated toxin RatA of RatAB toxin-antitoxin module|nr:type II toxin-antitoxin system RatA family toxin [Methylophilaceae bacterium]|tara:strand:- start:74 stop:508 length:435 start_codon:yes stop_codon:yes gene_type:complete